MKKSLKYNHKRVDKLTIQDEDENDDDDIVQ
jgi:hypothetical protein